MIGGRSGGGLVIVLAGNPTETRRFPPGVCPLQPSISRENGQQRTDRRVIAPPPKPEVVKATAVGLLARSPASALIGVAALAFPDMLGELEAMAPCQPSRTTVQRGFGEEWIVEKRPISARQQAIRSQRPHV